MTEWISMKDRLPKKDGEYIVSNGSKVVTTAIWFDNIWRYSKNHAKDIFLITHWMPLPEPPTKELNND